MRRRATSDLATGTSPESFVTRLAYEVEGILADCASVASSAAVASSVAVAATARSGRAPPASTDDATQASHGGRGGGRPDSPVAVGIGIPGLIDAATGTIVRCTGLPFLDGFAVADALGRNLNLPVGVVTDAEAAAWGEYTACEPGTASRPRPGRFIHLRLGSGVACGIVIDGQVVPLDEPRTTHAPTLIVDRSPAARACACGLRGCLETIASGRALEQRAAERPACRARRRTVPRLRSDDPDTDDAASEVVEAVCTALENLCERIRPDVIVLGGGALAHRPGWLSGILEAWTGRGYPVRIERARLGDEAGVVGAALRGASHAASPPTGQPGR